MYKILLIIFLSLFSFNTNAAWVTIDDAPILVKQQTRIIHVNNDATSSEIYEFKAKLLNEEGRKEYGNIQLVYNGNTSSLKILEAYSIVNGKKHKVDLTSIEDKPLASSSEGFDQSRQVLISYPKVEVGSEIYFKIIEHKNIPDFENYYSKFYMIGTSGCQEAGEIKIISEIPLYTEINDKENVLKIINLEKNNKYHLNIKLTKPICRKILNSTEVGVMGEDKYEWVSISSIKEWKDFGKKIGEKYANVIKQKLPKSIDEKLKDFTQIPSQIDQINQVIDFIHSKFRYMGYWNSVKGQYIPRDLSVIAKSQEADCKDFSALTAAILNKIGNYKVQPVLIKIEEGNFISTPHEMPDMEQFNHVFLKITLKDGTILWVDPTSSIIMANGLMPHLTEKMVLVLDPIDPSYERTPSNNNKYAEQNIYVEFDINDNKTTTKGHFSLENEAAIQITGSKLYSSEERIKNQLFNSLAHEHLEPQNQVKMILPDLNSRIVKDLKFEFEFIQYNNLYKTNMGYAKNIDTAIDFNKILDAGPDQLADIYIGSLAKYKTTRMFKNIKIENIESFNREINSPWIDFKRSAKYNGTDLVIIDDLFIKKSHITNKELTEKTYKDFKDYCNKNVKKVMVVFK